MKNNKFIKTIFTLILLSAALALQAQVTMGDETDPQSFSILEIISGGKGGLRLPQLDNGERQKVEDSQVFKDEIILKGRGLMIYNTDTDCVEYWNKEKWISLCDNSKPKPPCVEITGVTISGTTTYAEGQTINLMVNSITPSEAIAITYQWNKDGSPIPGATGATYSKICCTSADTGSYSVTVSNSCTNPALSSSITTITVNDVACTGDPVINISSSPVPASITAGATVILTATATGNSCLSYQWTKNGTNIPEATNATYTITGFSYADVYRCIVTDKCGSTELLWSACGAMTVDGEWLSFMCHNLGVNEPLDPFTPSTALHGDLYQWGRPKDGHQKRNSGTTETLAISNVPGHSSFIKAPDSPYDWRSGGGNTARWGDGTTGTDQKKADNDPCPAGWKVPSQAQWGSIFRGGITSGVPSTATANTWTSKGTWNTTTATGGWQVGDALFLPAAGFRLYINASLTNVGTSGDYSSSTVNGTYSYLLTFDNTIVRPGNHNPRAYGFSVRCVAE